MTDKGFTASYIVPNKGNIQIQYPNVATATTALLMQYSPRTLARALGINVTHIYRAKQRDYTPTYYEALYRAGFLKSPPKRRRTVGQDVPTDYTEEMAAMFRLMHQAYSHVADAQIRAMFKDGK